MVALDRDSLDRVLLGRAVVDRYPFPGCPEVEVGFRCLSEPELMEARLAARVLLGSWAALLGLTLDAFLDSDPEWEESQVQRQVLLRAACDPDTRGPFFPGPGEVGALGETTTISLVELWLRTQRRAAPRIETKEEGKALQDALLAESSELDRARAVHAAGIASYYGLRSAHEATDLQVFYFLSLVSEHEARAIRAHGIATASSFAQLFTGRPRRRRGF